MEGSGVIGREELEEACDQYLAALRCVLWGQPFEVVSKEGRKEAVRWLADQIEGVAGVVGRG